MFEEPRIRSLREETKRLREKYGVPKRVYKDNGKEYRLKAKYPWTLNKLIRWAWMSLLRVNIQLLNMKRLHIKAGVCINFRKIIPEVYFWDYVNVSWVKQIYPSLSSMLTVITERLLQYRRSILNTCYHLEIREHIDKKWKVKPLIKAVLSDYKTEFAFVLVRKGIRSHILFELKSSYLHKPIYSKSFEDLYLFFLIRIANISL